MSVHSRMNTQGFIGPELKNIRSATTIGRSTGTHVTIPASTILPVGTDGSKKPDATGAPVSLLDRPRSFWVGSLEFMEVDFICRRMRMTKKAALAFLTSLKIPLLYVNRTSYFLFTAFELALYILMRLGSTGFAAPGSHYKNSSRARYYKERGIPATELKDGDLRTIFTRELISEMILTNSPSTDTLDRINKLMQCEIFPKAVPNPKEPSKHDSSPSTG